MLFQLASEQKGLQKESEKEKMGSVSQKTGPKVNIVLNTTFHS